MLGKTIELKQCQQDSVVMVCREWLVGGDLALQSRDLGTLQSKILPSILLKNQNLHQQKCLTPTLQCGGGWVMMWDCFGGFFQATGPGGMCKSTELVCTPRCF